MQHFQLNWGRNVCYKQCNRCKPPLYLKPGSRKVLVQEETPTNQKWQRIKGGFWRGLNKKAPMEGQTEHSHPWAHRNFLPSKGGLKEPNKSMKFTEGLQGRKKYYLKRQIPQSRPQKPLKLSHESVQTLWQNFCGAAGASVWRSDKSQATAVLLMQRKEIHQRPVRIQICPGQICAETDVMLGLWPRLDLGNDLCRVMERGKLPGIVLLMVISWREIGEILLLSCWSPVVPAWASSGVAVSALLLVKHCKSVS